MVIDKEYKHSFDTIQNIQHGTNTEKLLYNCTTKTITLECSTGYCIPFDYFNDLIPDCPLDNDGIPADEELYYHLMFNRIKGKSCENSSLLHCYIGHPKCFAISDLCYFDHDINGNLKVCRNGAHLRNCSFYQCCGTFKCPDSYCVPYFKVCDGTWHCPHGEDEIQCNSRSCSGQFKWKASSICVHLYNLCDGISHCPGMDDEFYCNAAECPKGCSCYLQIVWCEGLQNLEDVTLFKYNSTVVRLIIINSQIDLNHFILGQY